jgi:hypothetical protein
MSAVKAVEGKLAATDLELKNLGTKVGADRCFMAEGYAPHLLPSAPDTRYGVWTQM